MRTHQNNDTGPPRSDMTLLARAALQYYTRHFPISKGKTQLIGLLWKPLSFGKYRCTTTLQGSNVKMSCDLRYFIQRNLFFWGAYENEYCRYWRGLACKANVIFDLGANVGLYSLLAAEANPNASIHAFEPTSELAEILRGNVALNGFENIEIVQVAVGKSSGSAILRECRGSDGANEGMNYIAVEPETPEISDRLVSVVSLPDYLRDQQIGQIDLLKMDIEGGEYEALLGAQAILESKSVRCLFIEFAEWAAKRSGHSTQEVARLLLDTGYRLYRVNHGAATEVQSERIPDGENIVAFASTDCARLAFQGQKKSMVEYQRG